MSPTSTPSDDGPNERTQPSSPGDGDDLGALADLSAAYAQLIDRGAVHPQDVSDRLPDGQSPETSELAVPEQVDPRSILEAMLFVGSPQGEPLSSRKVASLIRGVSPREIDELVQELNALYTTEGCPYEIASRGAGYVLQLRDEFAGLRDRFYGKVQEARLSQAAVDVLALVAYRQPITKEEIDRLRGHSSSQVLALLVRRGLLRLERSPDQPKQPRYHTTERFLALFQLSDLSELPQAQLVTPQRSD